MQQPNYANHAIVMQGGLRFVGEVIQPTDPDSTKLINAFELTIHIIPIPTPGGVMMQKQIVCSPVLVTSMVSTLTLNGSFTIQYFKDLHEVDIRRYINLIESAEKMAMQQRAQEAGIVMAGAQQ